MKKPQYLNYFFGVILVISSCFSFANSNEMKDINTSLTDSRVPTLYLPIEKSNIGATVSYTFVDKTSVKIHPYNALIRTYTRVINYGPALMQDKDGVSVPYRSMVIQEFVNCDKKEHAKGLIETYENYFGAGALQSTNNLPKRWEATSVDSKERQNLIVICSLPLNK